MLLQAKTKDKRGLSAVIAYILLISISITISILVFQWLRTYVPKDSLECSEGTSVFIKDITYSCSANRLTITLANNGRFSVDGYYIRVSNQSGDQLAVIDISLKIASGGEVYGNAVQFNSLSINNFKPSSGERTAEFNVAGYGTLYKVEIVPTRFQTIDNKNRFLSCGNAKVEEILACSA